MASGKYGILLYALIEMQKLGADLLEQLSLEHVDGNDPDPEKAFINIISTRVNSVENLRSMKFSCNKSKIFDMSLTPPVVKNRIDLQTIDTTLQHDMLFWLDGFPVSKPVNPNDRVVCSDCTRQYKKKEICCDRCKKCNQCNGLSPQQCAVFKLKIGLEKDRLLRNLVAHLTLKVLQNFLDGNGGFPDFPRVNTWNDLCQEFLSAMTYLCDYMSDPGNFHNNNVHVQTPREKAYKLSKMETIMNMTVVDGSSDVDLLLSLKDVFDQQRQQQIQHHQQQMEQHQQQLLFHQQQIQLNQQQLHLQQQQKNEINKVIGESFYLYILQSIFIYYCVEIKSRILDFNYRTVSLIFIATKRTLVNVMWRIKRDND